MLVGNMHDTDVEQVAYLNNFSAEGCDVHYNFHITTPT
jgi:hypothetical protein